MSLVGAGPGDPELITLKGLDRIRKCEAVVYDRLIPFQLLDEVPPTAERIDVGKHPGCPKVSQAEIHEILIRKAREGKRVVRLKGGDPGIFGRVGEEISALEEAGIPFEVIPGVTAGVAAAAAARIPLTSRDSASSVTFVTGHEDPSKGDSQLDWEELARAGTLVVYMIGQHLSEICEKLIDAGRSPSTPTLLVREAAHPTESITRSTLGEIEKSQEVFAPGFPAVLIIGEVGRRGRPSMIELPLREKTVVLTHPAETGDILRSNLTRWGARVVLCPSIQIEAIEDISALRRSLSDVSLYDWILFTSKNAVQVVRDLFEMEEWDPRRFGKVKIASVGKGTSRVLEEWGLRVDLAPSQSTAEDLYTELDRHQEVMGKRFLFPCSEIARDSLEESLRGAGGSVDRVTAYRTVTSKDIWDPGDPLHNLEIDGICFTSSSTVRGFHERVGEEFFQALSLRARVFSIGPKTSGTLKQFGVHAYLEPEVSDFEGLSNLILKSLGSASH